MIVEHTKNDKNNPVFDDNSHSFCRKKFHEMVHYKLVYFPLRARAEIARQIFAYAGQDYSEENLSFEQWPARKNSEFIHFWQR